jgi:tetratricopeptide (TPR) repeat protein
MAPHASLAVRRKVADRWGFELTATEAGQQAWEAAASALMAMSSEAPRLLNALAVVDPDLALGRALRAFANRFLPSPAWDTAAELMAAERMLPNISPRESSAVYALARLVRGGPRAAFGPLRDHLAEFPGDPVAAHALHVALLGAGQGKLAHRLVEAQARVARDDCGWLGLVAFARADQRRYEEAAKLAEQALRASPRDANAAHALMHCHYETGEHAAGLRWLTSWLSGGASLGHFKAHFPWHAAMHELAQGDLDAARRRCGTQIPAEATADIAPLLWRFRLVKASVGRGLARAAVSAAPCTSRSVPTTFAGMNLALCLGAADDSTGLEEFARYIAHDPRPEVADLLAPLVGGLIALLGQRPRDAVDLLTPVAARVAQLGGSRMQGEIVEDTLLLALIDAGRRDDALALLGRRLDGRPPTQYEYGLLAT